ncbi:hypothetical protein [Pleurocapsa sp. PCC 7319]|uniref:hypothetical protein n=1 Tax=Pleurocapsa sp. PCC 7319 TaxID=118161 RepID=UPI0003489833|nr:hypothetical protein [Pleurocapsa sp. PCC 7319]
MSKIESSTTSDTISFAPQHRGESDLFSRVIAALKQANHNLCVLHGYKNYPEGITSDSDIDAISQNPEQIPQLLIEQDVAQVVQVLQHETTAFSYILCREYEGNPALIQLDVSKDYRRNGRVFFQGKDFLSQNRPYKFFSVPKAELEFAYYLVKKLAKGAMDESQAQRLSELYQEQPDKCDLQLKHFLPEVEAKLIAETASSGNWQPVYEDIQNLRSALLGKVGRANPLEVLHFWAGELVRIIKRIRQPTGLMVVFLGADGSGKSTAIAEIQEKLTPVFRQTQYIHLRPKLGLGKSDNSPPVLDPHGQLPRSWLTSTLKLFYFLIDYSIGYIFQIYPQLVRSTFVVFDRYYHDLLVDTRRYRYGGSNWLAKLVGWLIPQPDLWILLDAPAEVLQARKQEVSFEETARQQEAYVKLVRSLPNGYIVDASRTIEEVESEVESIVLSEMTKRTAKRLGLKNL